MITKMVMPELSITSGEVKLIAWLKKPGDAVTRGEAILSVETDKATVEVESYVNGYFRVANFPDGAVVPLDAVIAILTTTPDESLEEQTQPAADGTHQPIVFLPAVDTSSLPSNRREGRLEITPVAKKIARDNDIDLSLLDGTGPSGRILRADVEAALRTRVASYERQVPIISGPVKEAHFSSARKAIAQRTALSKATIPHYYVSIDIDMLATLDLVNQLKNKPGEQGLTSPTLTDFIILACGKLLPSYPMLHGSWTDNGPEINPEINIGMVIGLEEGLIVPVLHNVDRMNLTEVTKTSRNLKLKAKQGGMTSHELMGGSFTISNLGMFGINSFIAVINPPESVILALGGVIKRAVPNENDEVVVRPIMTATLSVDHRMVDGILASKFLTDLREKLERPALLFFGS